MISKKYAAPDNLKDILLEKGCIPYHDGEFYFQNFTGLSDEAMKNCQIIWPGMGHTYNPNWVLHRKFLTRLVPAKPNNGKKEEKWWEYIQRTIGRDMRGNFVNEEEE